jgi:hypothetical protein
MEMAQYLNRRNFTQLSMAALGGTLAGSALSGCKSDNKAAATSEKSLLLTGQHVCRGLNTCKSKGACKTAGNDCKGKNACAGQGKCASAKAHTCHKENSCKGEGGCGELAGVNACKGKGKCGVPLKDETWTKVRAKFATAMTKSGKKVGPAPKK